MSDAPRKVGRGLWRGVYSAMVDHLDFQALTPNARLTLFICRVGSMNTAASIFRYYLEPLQQQTGLSRDELVAALHELEKKPSPKAPWIVRDEAVLWIRNGLKHDPNLSLNHHGHREAIIRALAALPSTPTVRKFRAYYKLSQGRGSGSPQETGMASGEPGGIRNPSSTPIPTPTPTPNPNGHGDVVSYDRKSLQARLQAITDEIVEKRNIGRSAAEGLALKQLQDERQQERAAR
jgi:hypothetical protein